MLQKSLRLLEQFGLIAIICIIGTLIDVVAHNVVGSWRVESDYFTVNFILGPLWAFLTYRVFKHYFKKYQTFAVLVSFNEAFLAQSQHLLQGYSVYFVMFFMVLHFFFFLSPAVLFFRNFRNVFEVE